MEKQQLVEFEPFTGMQDYNNLVCPNCGDRYLHHAAVRVYNRKEDASNCRKTFAGDDHSRTSISDNRENPSRRRDGLTIDFTCEGCSGGEVVAQLCVAQHKGTTEIFWRAV